MATPTPPTPGIGTIKSKEHEHAEQQRAWGRWIAARAKVGAIKVV